MEAIVVIAVFTWFNAHGLTQDEIKDTDYLFDILSNYEEEYGELDIDVATQLINEYQCLKLIK